jgi:hypothetical protein
MTDQQTVPRQRQRIHWTPQAALARLDDLEADLDLLLDALATADLDWEKKDSDADDAENRHFLCGEGAVEVRKRSAQVAHKTERDAARVAAAVVRDLKNRLRATEGKLDSARTRVSSIRAEVSLAQSGRGRP